MLKFMRKHATGYTIKALFGGIIIVFIFWGVGSFHETDRVVAEIGNHKVTTTEYQDTYNRTLEMYRTLYGEKFDENLLKELKLKKSVMNEITDRYILLIMANKLGMTTSDNEFLDYIHAIDAFKRDGKFDDNQYLAVLQKNKLDPKKFEASEKKALLARKAMNFIKDNGTFFSEADIWEGYVKEKGQVNLSYKVFDPASFRGKVDVSEKDLTDLYEKEKANHRSENNYRLKYTTIDVASPVKDDAVYMDLLKEKDIERYAKKNGLNTVDLGLIKESEALKKLNNLKAGDWLKGLRKGDVTLPIREGSKSYIFQLVDMQEGQPLDKGVAIAVIKERVVAEKAKDLARLAAEEAIARKSIDFKKKTGFMPRSTHEIKGIGIVPRESLDLFALSKTNPFYDKPVEVTGKIYIFSFKDEKLPDRQDCQKEKARYKQYFVTKNREEFYRAFMAEQRTKGRIRVSWKEI